ncbi:MAG: sulfatase-like hydrolase/transferase [Saprospiraceae bacterium]
MKYFQLLLFVIFIVSCADDTPDNPEPETKPNILLIIADDMGKDATNGYSEGNIKPNTPNIDKIKNDGLTFNNVWTNPTCSPTRSAIITGKYGYRTGVKWAGDELDASENILHNYINEITGNAYATAVVGKWHLSSFNNFNPEILGLDYYAGLIRGNVQDYYDWRLTEDGVGNFNTNYITEVFTDLAKDWVNTQTKPWFLWLAYNAPHTPFHVPPNNMHSQGNLPDYVDGMDETPYYMAAIEALDFQIGELMKSMTEEELNNTIIIFIGDNGTPNQVAQSPYSFSKAKGSLYQGGVNVPMFVSGKGVTRTGSDNSLIVSTDLFSTIAQLAGSTTTEIHDSKSFKSLLTMESTHRDFQYTERDNGTDDAWTISDGEYKLIVNANGNNEFYHLTNDPYENNNLENGTLTNVEISAKAALQAELMEIRN